MNKSPGAASRAFEVKADPAHLPISTARRSGIRALPPLGVRAPKSKPERIYGGGAARVLHASSAEPEMHLTPESGAEDEWATQISK